MKYYVVAFGSNGGVTMQLVHADGKRNAFVKAIAKEGLLNPAILESEYKFICFDEQKDLLKKEHNIHVACSVIGMQSHVFFDEMALTKG